jgi:hypothetical protein
MTKNKILLLLVGVAALSGCEPKREPIVKEFDRTGQEVCIVVNSYETEKDLHLALKNRIPGYNLDQLQNTRLYGQAIWSPSDNKCEIFSLLPKSIDDEHTLTIGHELLHCIYGSYH